MTIFHTYTGNAILNNALMTIEALAKLNNVSEINPDVLTRIYTDVDLRSINKRLKSYTMLFTKNGPLHNDKTNGDKVYESLFKTIVSNFESEGSKICEISGLKFNKTFSELYKLALKEEGIGEKEILKKDTNISRTWFPLIGGLGSDAQALPQAKFAIQIHPICIVILQFLPLSSLLYKGGVLLFDSSNFELSRQMIADHTKILSERIQSVSVKESVENIKDFAKGNYLIKVLEILKQKEEYEETYSDLNMWSFSNSGTGASCEIDRVPNSLIKKLQILYSNPKIGNELKSILTKKETSYSFLEALEGSIDWYLLYPNVFGSGKKAVTYDGVSPEFLESYYRINGRDSVIPMAKYSANLINRYKSKSFEKLLEKTDAWNNPEYKIEMYKVYIKATEQNEWSLMHHVGILDNKDELPIKNNFYRLQKLIHYYTQKKIQSDGIPKINESNTKVLNACKLIIKLIQHDPKANTIKSNLNNPNESNKVGYNRIIFDALDNTELDFNEVVEIFYDKDFNYRKYGLSELLRIFFSQPQQQNFQYSYFNNQMPNESLFINWMNRIDAFTKDYQNYYYAKYKNLETGKLPYNKFLKTIESLIKENNNFYGLLREAIFNTNTYITETQNNKADKWIIEDLMTNPIGNSNQNICLLTIKFLLKQAALKPLKNQLLEN